MTTPLDGLDEIKSTLSKECYICKDPVPEQPWCALVEVDGKVVASPMCDSCDKAQMNMTLERVDENTFAELRH